MVNFKAVLLLPQSHFGRGAYIVRQGAAGDTFYIISEGKVKVTQKKEGKSSYAVYTLQVDPTGCSLGSVDTQTKVAFQYTG